PRLLHRLPVNDATLKPSTGLTEYRSSRYFARLPTCTAEAGSLALCTANLLWLPSDPTVGQRRPSQSDCLPLRRADATFFQVAGCGGFAGQTKRPRLQRSAFLCPDFSTPTSGKAAAEHQPHAAPGKGREPPSSSGQQFNWALWSPPPPVNTYG